MPDVPSDFKMGHYTYSESVWAKTPEGEAYAARIIAESATAQCVEDDEDNITSDSFLKQLRTLSMDDVDDYINNQYTAFADLTDAEIGTQIDSLTTVSQIQGALKILAQDNVRSKKLIKITTKIAVYLFNKGGY